MRRSFSKFLIFSCRNLLILLALFVLTVSLTRPAHAATFTVNTLTDGVSANALISLPKAIANANNDNGVQTDYACDCSLSEAFHDAHGIILEGII